MVTRRVQQVDASTGETTEYEEEVIFPPDYFETRQKIAIGGINDQARHQAETWHEVFLEVGGNYLAAINAIEDALRSTRNEAVAALRAATTIEQIEAVVPVWPSIPSRASIEDRLRQSDVAVREIREFVALNPAARNLIAMDWVDLQPILASPTPAQASLLRQVDGLAIRVLWQIVRD